MMPLYQMLHLMTLPLLQEPGPALPQLMSGPGKRRIRQTKETAYLPTISVQLPVAGMAASVQPYTLIASKTSRANMDGMKQHLAEEQLLRGTNSSMPLPEWKVPDMPGLAALVQLEEDTLRQQNISHLYSEQVMPVWLDERRNKVTGNNVNYPPLVTSQHAEPTHRGIAEKLLPALADVPKNSTHSWAHMRDSQVLAHGLSLPEASRAPETAHKNAVMWRTLLPDVVQDEATYADATQMSRLREMIVPLNPDTQSIPEYPKHPTSAERMHYPTPANITVHMHNKDHDFAGIRQEIEAVLLEIFDTTNHT
jgi:hypothetical protein